MTQAPAPIQAQNLTDADAAELAGQIGCLVCELFGEPGALRVRAMHPAPEPQARRDAADLAERHPGSSFVVFKPAATYHAQPAAGGEG